MPLKKRLLVAFGVLVAAILAADLVLAVLVRGGSFQGYPVPPYGTFREPETRARLQRRLELERARTEPAGTFDRELGWVNRPGPHLGAGESGTINSLGARGAREYEARPAPGVLRLACFGESFTFGSEVGDEHSWPARLEALDPGIEALNLGVAGYGTDQALLLFRRTGPLGARVVVVGLLLENLCRNVSRFRSFYVPQTGHPVVKPRFVLRRGELELLPIPYADLAQVYEAALSGDLAQRMGERDYWAGEAPVVGFSGIARALASRSARRRRNHSLQLLHPGEPYELTLALLETFRREALESGAERFLVLVFPTADDIRYLVREGAKPWYSALGRDLAARDVEHLDFIPIVLESAAPTDLYLPGGHFTPEGNELVARQVLDRLRERWPR